MENTCNYCNSVDDLLHFFFFFEYTDKFWCSFYKWWNNVSETSIIVQDTFEECIMFGYPGEEDLIIVLNYCVLLAKYFIYVNKLNGKNKIDLYDYLVLLKRKIFLEKTICTQQNQLNHFNKWEFLDESLYFVCMFLK